VRGGVRQPFRRPAGNTHRWEADRKRTEKTKKTEKKILQGGRESISLRVKKIKQVIRNMGFGSRTLGHETELA